MTDIKRPHEMGLRHGIGYSMRRYYVDLFFFSRKKDFVSANRILDLGGTRGKKRGQFNLYDHTEKVLTANISADKGTDIVCDGACLPLADDSFDVIICAEVLEHVTSPEKILSEISRVLSPGGRAYITAPFLFPIHADPHDYRRFTPACWKYMLTEARLIPLEIIQQGTFWSVLADIFRIWIYRKARPKILRYGLYGIIRFLEKLAIYKETNPHILNDEFYSAFATGYGIVALKNKIDEIN
jgi:ubiquinone/menaquinone biosynthesis C-methylase UbiE